MLQYEKDGKVLGWWKICACWSPPNSQSFAFWLWYQHPSFHLKHSRCLSQRTKTKEYKWIVQKQANFEIEFYLKWQQLCKSTLWFCRWFLLAFSVVSHSYTNKNETSHMGPQNFATSLSAMFRPSWDIPNLFCTFFWCPSISLSCVKHANNVYTFMGGIHKSNTSW